MKHSFYAHLTATITFTDEEFNLIWTAAESHYSADCRNLTQPGGILYGNKNVREFVSNDSRSDITSTIGMDCNQRQLGKLMKSMEMHLSDERYQNLSSVIYSIAMELQSKETKANSFLDLLK